MKALVYNKKAKSKKMSIMEVEKPIPKADEVLIKVYFTPINASDYRSKKMGMVPKHKIFGSGASGTVSAIGENVDQFKVDDEVIAEVADYGFGAFAEYVVAPIKVVTIKPKNVSFEDAASLPVASTTAWKAIHNKAKIKEGDEVLIVGCSGGVGTFAIQICKALGAHVTGVCSAGNVDQSKSLGADEVIDYTQADFLEGNKKYDKILAINGNYSLLKYKMSLKPGGTYVMIGGSMSQIFKSLIFGKPLSLGSKKMLTLSAKSDSKTIESVAKLMAEGKINSSIEKIFPFKEGAKAFEYVESGHAKGKVLIKIL